MRITVELPDDVARHSEAGREALEALVIQGYREGTLSHYESSCLLGISRFELDAFLKNRNVHEHAYGVPELEQDFDDLRRFEARNPPGHS